MEVLRPWRKISPGASGLFLLWAKQHSFTFAQAEVKGALFPLPHPHPPTPRRPWFCKRSRPGSRVSSTSSLPLDPWRAHSHPNQGSFPAAKGEGNLPAQGESKGARTADQSAFPSWALSTSPPDPRNHLPTAHEALVLTSLQPVLYISTRMLLLKCNSDHVPLLLKILQQVPKIFGIEILTILHGTQAPSCFGFLTTSHSPSPVPSP